MLHEDHLIYDVLHVQWQNHLYQVYEILHSAKINDLSIFRISQMEQISEVYCYTYLTLTLKNFQYL
jgi:hypothetical protein